MRRTRDQSPAILVRLPRRPGVAQHERLAATRLRRLTPTTPYTCICLRAAPLRPWRRRAPVDVDPGDADRRRAGGALLAGWAGLADDVRGARARVRRGGRAGRLRRGARVRGPLRGQLSPRGPAAGSGRHRRGRRGAGVDRPGGTRRRGIRGVSGRRCGARGRARHPGAQPGAAQPLRCGGAAVRHRSRAHRRTARDAAVRRHRAAAARVGSAVRHARARRRQRELGGCGDHRYAL